MDKLRGHNIELIEGSFYYCDTGEPTTDTFRNRPCGHCSLHNTPEDHDGCLGTLPGLMNACCGHGQTNEAYIQFNDTWVVRGQDALNWINENKKEVLNDEL